MQGTGDHFLVQEDPTCLGAARPLSPSYLARESQLLSSCSRVCVLQLLSPCAATTEAHVPWSQHVATAEPATTSVLQLLKPMHLEPALHTREARAPQLESRPCSLQLEKAHVQHRRPSAAKKKYRKQIQRCVHIKKS